MGFIFNQLHFIMNQLHFIYDGLVFIGGVFIGVIFIGGVGASLTNSWILSQLSGYRSDNLSYNSSTNLVDIPILLLNSGK